MVGCFGIVKLIVPSTKSFLYTIESHVAFSMVGYVKVLAPNTFSLIFLLPAMGLYLL